MRQLYTLLLLILIVNSSISQEIEPNDIPDQAQDLIFNVEINGDISTTDLNDWYRFELDQAGLFEIDIRKAEGNIIFWVYLKDGEMENEPLINQVRMFNEDTLFTLSHHLLEGSYYIHIGTATNLIPYQLTPRFIQNTWADDVEPNNTDSMAQTIFANDEKTGSILYYEAGVGNDGQDWYKLELEEAGRLELEIEKSVLDISEFTIYLRDGEKDGNPTITQFRLLHSDSIHTLVQHLLEGTYYIQIASPFIPNTYRLATRLILPDWASDSEPNHSDSTAVTVDPNSVISGTILYYEAGKGNDSQDWYQMEIVQAGHLELKIQKAVLGSSEFTVYLRDAEQVGFPVIKQLRLFHSENNVFLRKHLLPGNYFIQIGAPWIPNNYQIVSSFTFPQWQEDYEPNNDTSQAQMITLPDSITGNLRFYEAGIGNDIEDWYVFEIAEEGLLKLDINKENNDGIFWVYLRDPSQEGNPVVNQIRIFFDQFQVKMNQYFQPGKYFIQVGSPSRDLEYLIKPRFIKRPKPDFEYTQANNTILFRNNSLAGDSFTWDFGDGNHSTVINPLHDYENPGIFDVCLTVTNEAGTEEICKPVTVLGLASVYPNTAGNTGFATLSVYGGGLDSNSIMILENNGIPLKTQETTFLFQRDAMRAQFDLRGLEENTYDLVVENSTGNRFLLENAFTVETGTKPDPWIEVNGRNRILFNTPTTYTVRYGNNGNVDAMFVPIWLAFSETPDLEIDFTGGFFVDPHSVEDSIKLVEDQNSKLAYFTTDTVFREPLHARVYPLFIPVIPANTTQEFSIKIKTSQNLRILSWANEPFIQIGNSEERNEQSEFVITCLGEILSQNFKDAFAPPLSSFERSCILDEYKHIILEFAKSYGDMSVEAFIKLFSTYSLRKSALVMHIGLISNTIRKCAPRFANKAELGQHVTNVLILQYLTDKEALRSCRSPRKENACNPARVSGSEKQFETCQQCGTFCPINIIEWIINAVSSFDPNEKDQPSGYAEENYTFFRKNIPYTIHFENLDSATAPAHIVKVVDTLDSNVFDFSSFEFGSVSIGDSIYYPDKGFTDLVLDASLHELGVVARIEGAFDTLTGELSWIFRSLDPITFEAIEDPDIGFLPPNISKPEGQGSVSFFIDLKTNLKNEDQILNKALIYFDANEPIETNISKFTLDLGLPESQVMSLDAETTDTLVLLEWAGSDNESGVRLYDVYYSKDDDEFVRWRSRTSLTSDYFDAEPDSYYRFFSIAIDSVGNEELIPVDWDTETSIVTSSQELESIHESLQILTNPVKDVLKLRLTLDKNQRMSYYITDVLSSQLLRSHSKTLQSGENKLSIPLEGLSDGIYFIQLNFGGKLISRKFILMN